MDYQQKIMDKLKRAILSMRKILINFNIYYLFHYNQMKQDIQSQSIESARTTNTAVSSSKKSDVDLRRDKKRRLAAFKTFLDNKIEAPSLTQLTPKRKLSTSLLAEEAIELSGPPCKICGNIVSAQSKLCQFCKQQLCITHFRKRRRYPGTNRWTRICQFCEDKYLMQKHFQNEMKTQESLITEQMVVEARHHQLSQILTESRARLQAGKEKQRQLENKKKIEGTRTTNQLKVLQKKLTKIDLCLKENSTLENSLKQLQKKMPISLQADYEFLQKQNERLTLELVKIEKQCIDAVKTRCKRERQMYKEYYDWEEKRKKQLAEVDKKQQQCIIY